ncbi:MAG TPA: PIN domain-containing protein, partial [Nakamurella sp.]
MVTRSSATAPNGTAPNGTAADGTASGNPAPGTADPGAAGSRLPAPGAGEQASPAAGVGQSAPPDAGGQSPAGRDRLTYVIDTSVLLSDPWALNRFDEHEVILPLVVIGELEGKRHHPELGYFARQSLRLLDELRIEHGRLDAPVPVGSPGGTLHVELNHTDSGVLPAGVRNDSNDSRILACALNLALERPAGSV